jgi:hypothetical protein
MGRCVQCHHRSATYRCRRCRPRRVDILVRAWRDVDRLSVPLIAHQTTPMVQSDGEGWEGVRAE